MNEQREIIYSRRNEILDQESIHERVLESFRNTVQVLVQSHIQPEGYLTDDDKSEIIEYFNTNYIKSGKSLSVDKINELNEQEVIDYLTDEVIKDYNKKMDGNIYIDEFEKAIALRVIDDLWVEHMNTMEHLKEGIGLRGYGQVNPVQAYTMEGFELFDEFMNRVDNNIAVLLLKAEVRHNIERKQTLEGKESSDGEKEKTKKSPKRVNKVGRNDPCPCGSGKKYKQCCGK
jgi:preprotein translocase subunit SecA